MQDNEVPESEERSLSGRLELLERTSVITPTARRLTAMTVDRISRDFGLELDEDNAGQLVTHVAMALARVERDEGEWDAPPVAETEMAELAEERAFAHDVSVEWARALGRDIPDGEVTYLAIHLAVLLTRERQTPGV